MRGERLIRTGELMLTPTQETMNSIRPANGIFHTPTGGGEQLYKIHESVRGFRLAEIDEGWETMKTQMAILEKTQVGVNRELNGVKTTLSDQGLQLTQVAATSNGTKRTGAVDGSATTSGT